MNIITLRNREANSHSAGQEISCLLCKPKYHYLVHNKLPQVPIQNHMNPAHIFPPYFFKIHLKVSSWSLLGCDAV